MICHLLAPNGKQEEELKRALEGLALPNVWFDLASVPHNCMDASVPWKRAGAFVRLARDLVGADKLLFGTDMPSALKEAPYGDYVRWIREMEGLNDEEREQILYQNAAKVYAGLS